MKGIWNKILVVDLTNSATRVIRLRNEDYSQFLGGYGLGIRLLFEHMPPNTNPLGPDNILGFFPGLLTGTGFPMTGRWMAVGKSPLTGLWNDSNCGGKCGPEMKMTGYDGFLFKGQAKSPTYVTIYDDQINFHDASLLWGKQTDQVHQILKKEYPNAKSLYIGPAGENLVRFACIIDDRFRAAARGGLGAVMGSKKFKAVVFRGSKHVPITNPKEFWKIAKSYRKFLKKKPSWIDRQPIKLLSAFTPLLRRLKFQLKPASAIRSEMFLHIQHTYGTCVATHLATQIGDAPIKNWGGVSGADFSAKSSEKISDKNVIKYNTKTYGCRNCYLRCGAKAAIKEGIWKDENHSKPEYEALASFGGLCLIDEVESIFKINSLCDRLGLDVISAGAVAAFALESYEKGLLKIKKDDLKLKWGNPEGVLKLVQLIGYRQGIGNLLAEGVSRVSEKLGPAATPLAIHVHGQELPMHDPKYDPNYGVAYLTDASPGRHTQAAGLLTHLPDVKKRLKLLNSREPERFDYSAQGVSQALISPYLHVTNSLGFCMFSLIVGNLPPFSKIITALIGMEYPLNSIFETGERILTLRHLFNLREGVNPQDFVLPDRPRGNPPHFRGPLKGISLDTDAIKRSFFSAMDWEIKTGIPSYKKLEYLGLLNLWNGFPESIEGNMLRFEIVEETV